MLQTIRDRASGWFAYAIIFLISIPFALWGINHYLEGGGSQNVALVDGMPISIQAFERAYRDERLRLSQMFGGELPANLDDKTLKQAVLRHLVQESVLTANLDKSGYKVADKALVKQITAYPVFQENGGFSNKKYQQVLAEQGISPSGFEHMLRKQLLIQQFQSGVYASAFVTKTQKDRLEGLLEEERKLGMVVVPLSKFLSSTKITPAEVKDYYLKHSPEFMTHEEVDLNYLRLTLSDFEKSINPSSDELKNYYDNHRAAYAKPDRLKYSEVVLDAPKSSAGNASVAAFAERMRALSGQKKDFKQGAIEYAHKLNLAVDSIESNVDGAKGQIPHALYNALSSLKPETVSEPVNYGGKLYVLKLDSVDTYTYPSFQEISSEIRNDYVGETAKKEYEKTLRRLSELTYEHPGSLLAASKALNLKVEKTGWFDKTGGAGITANHDVLKAAFSKSVLDEGTNSSVIELGSGDAVVIRVASKKPPSVKPLTEVENSIQGILQRQAAIRQTRQLADNIEKSIRDGSTVAGVAAKYELKYRDLGWVRRDDSAIPEAVLKSGFKLGVPSSEHKPSVTTASLGAGNYAVVTVGDVRMPREKPSEAKGAAAPATRMLAQQVQNQMMVVLQAMQQAAKIKVYPNNMNF